MTDLEKAARMALGKICSAKLCEFNSMSSRQEMIRLMDEAITALRQVLEQPAQQQDYWQEEARRYAQNADFWRGKYEGVTQQQDPVVELGMYEHRCPSVTGHRGPSFVCQKAGHGVSQNSYCKDCTCPDALNTSPPAQQEPVDWEKLYRLEVKKKEALAVKYERDIKPLTKIVPMAQPAQQEPVGEVYRHGRDSHGREWHGIHWYDANVDVPHGTKLYISPQPSKPWVSLTDKEITRMAAPWFLSMYWTLCNTFARDIEAKLKEKNGG